MTQQRYPAIPLVTHDPYFSIWSFSDELHSDWTHHWTGACQVLDAMVRVDGVAYLLCGGHRLATPAKQISCTVHPTRTIYVFHAGQVELELTFASPLLPDDLDVLSRPLSYIVARARSIDNAKHQVAFFFAANNDICVDNTSQPTVWGRHQLKGLRVMNMGSDQQRPLNRAGDDLRIDWGRLFLAWDEKFQTQSCIAPNLSLRKNFAATGELPASDDMNMPRSPAQGYHAMAVVFELGQVGAEGSQCHLMLAYDDIFSIEFLNRKLPGYWRRNGMTVSDLLLVGKEDFESLMARCAQFDAKYEADCRKVGGDFYATLNALAYRQAIAAHKLVADLDGRPLFFSKENFSNGCIATVDVTYPSAPLFLAVQPELLKGMLIPILEYAGLPRWRFPFAPHDLGTYPLANGQVYGGAETSEDDQMPIEECGNMLILMGALALLHNDWAFIERYYDIAVTWAKYLLAKGYDPENQLCTDDFAGHLAHNTNLSIKALIALELFSKMAEKLGHAEFAAECSQAAHAAARKWQTDADAGDHFRLAFDRPESWSQKYNLVWDRLFNLGLFDASVARKELAYYRKMQNAYGVPLDNRADYTKLDWILWSSVLTGSRADFDALLAPIQKWLAETPSRVPLTDWYDTKNGKHIFFRARSVVGGLAIALLFDPEVMNSYR